MRRRFRFYLTTIVTGIAVTTGLLAVGTVPAQAASVKISITASITTGVVGGKVTLTGAVSPKPSSRKIYLQRRYAGTAKWTTLKKFSTAKSGAYSVAASLTNDTDRFYRIYKKAGSGRKAGHSAAVSVIVNPAAKAATDPALAPAAPVDSIVTISPSTSTLSGGSKVILSGRGLAGTSRVSVTPQVRAEYLDSTMSVFPELAAAFTVSGDSQLQVTLPASLAGANLVKVYTPAGTLTTKVTYAMTARSASDFEQQVLEQVNLRRSSAQTCRGTRMPAVGALTWDATFADIALSHAKDMAARQGSGYDGLSHTTYGLKDWNNRFVVAGYAGLLSEDLALSSADSSASQVVQQWMKSTNGHCESVMDGHWTKAGIGVAGGSWDSQTSIWTNLDLR